jgi:hypothetical protein
MLTEGAGTGVVGTVAVDTAAGMEVDFMGVAVFTEGAGTVAASMAVVFTVVAVVFMACRAGSAAASAVHRAGSAVIEAARWPCRVAAVSPADESAGWPALAARGAWRAPAIVDSRKVVSRPGISRLAVSEAQAAVR